MSFHRHPPVSMRHAFALAFDLALRRDALHSLIVPLLIRTPWIVALALLPDPAESEQPGRIMLWTSCALIGDFVMWLIVTAMLRFRARSVFNTPPHAPPAPAAECYIRGLKRAPWLLITEVVRNAAIAFATPFLVLPAIFLSFRLSMATESVVLDEPHLAGAFARSWRAMEGRFERWLEMIVTTVLVVLSFVFAGAIMSLLVPGPGVTVWASITWLLITAITPIIQYAWTFFYLRLIEVEDAGIEVGPTYAVAFPGGAPASETPSDDADGTLGVAGGSSAHRPRLTLVEGGTPRDEQTL